MYKDLLSSKQDIFAGVLQGSVLGLLFLTYVNNVAVNMLSICRLFADDNSLQQSSTDVLDIECKLNHDLHILEQCPNNSSSGQLSIPLRYNSISSLPQAF